MAMHLSSSRHHYGENGNTLSINTDRVRPQDVLAVRGSPSPDRQFDPTAPVFVNGQGSATDHSANPETSMLPQGYSPAKGSQNTAHSYTPTTGMNMLPPGYSPAEYTQNAVDHRHIGAAQDQNMAVDEEDHMSYGQTFPHLAGAMRFPRPSLMSGPTQSPPLLARPRSAAIQHSPPRRPYHEPITASHVDESVQATISPSRVVHLRRRLDRLQEMKKLNLSSFEDATKRLATLTQNIESLQLGGNDRLQELYQSEFEYLDTDRAQDEHGRAFRRLEVETEELLGDLMVPHEAREENDCPAFAGE